jgi:acyl carrier protein
VEFDEFTRMLIERLEIEWDGEIVQSTLLVEDLSLDSMQVFLVMMMTESAAGLDVPPALIPVLVTVGDAFGYYRSSCALAAADSP